MDYSRKYKFTHPIHLSSQSKSADLKKSQVAGKRPQHSTCSSSSDVDREVWRKNKPSRCKKRANNEKRAPSETQENEISDAFQDQTLVWKIPEDSAEEMLNSLTNMPAEENKQKQQAQSLQVSFQRCNLVEYERIRLKEERIKNIEKKDSQEESLLKLASLDAVPQIILGMLTHVSEEGSLCRRTCILYKFYVDMVNEIRNDYVNQLRSTLDPNGFHLFKKILEGFHFFYIHQNPRLLKLALQEDNASPDKAILEALKNLMRVIFRVWEINPQKYKIGDDKIKT